MLLDYTLLEWAEIFSALSAVASLILVILYRRMAKIGERQAELQEQQTKIMDRQNRLMAASHKPDVRINSDKIQTNGNEVTIRLTNMGNGPARHLHIRCDARYYLEPSNQISPESWTTPLRRVHTTPREAMHQAHDGQSLEPDDTILAEESDIKFAANISLAVPSQNEGVASYLPFDRGITELVEADVESIRVHLFLIYEDIAGEKDETQIQSLGRHCEIEEGMQLEDVIEQGSSSSYGGTVTVEPKSRKEKIWTALKRLFS